jgi:hypothetical protein
MYIPKSKLDPQIYYTPGGEYYYSTTRSNYEGYYHKDLNGRAYTGKEHTNESIHLIPFLFSRPNNIDVNGSNGISNQYDGLNSSVSINVSVPIPQSDSLPPNEQDYTQSFYIRYILQYKLSSNPVFVEVNKVTFFQYFNTSYKQYFSFVEVPWKISGPLYDVKENNVLVEGGIIDSNLRSIDMANRIMPGVRNYFTDVTLYAK